MSSQHLLEHRDAGLRLETERRDVAGTGIEILPFGGSRRKLVVVAIVVADAAAKLNVGARPARDFDKTVFVEGGDAAYLCHWVRESGLADLLPSLRETVWVGVSGGSMVMTPRIGDVFVSWPSATDDRTLGIVDFSIFPHLDNPDLTWNTMANAEEWAAVLSGPAYAVDDDTAFKVVDGTVEIVSEGQWKVLNPEPQAGRKTA